ncbi:MAG TPA: Hsp20/alpha crystallin family protein [Kiritimatiellia bacterium]|nr:Hsp20/alpha crystallin family protein [Kiritimatiellia bacterium]HRU70490.1 Hsp20/alpha crystallin family protein [Kiritimatiellia bacterium]
MRAYLNTISNPWRVFDELMGDFPFDLFDTALRVRAGRFPRVNVWESEDGLAVQAEVAGVDPEKLDVVIDANVLTIKGEREQADGGRTEFQRSFNLPFELEDSKIKAAVKNGLLTVTIPRKAAEKRKIAIEKL